MLNEPIWPLPFAFSGSIRLALALAIAVPSVVLVVGALRLFRAAGQDPKPWVATPEIVRAGVYRFTRNPMYLGLALLQAAIGISLGNFWIVLLGSLSCLLVQITVIRPNGQDVVLKLRRSMMIGRVSGFGFGATTQPREC